MSSCPDPAGLFRDSLLPAAFFQQVKTIFLPDFPEYTIITVHIPHKTVSFLRPKTESQSLWFAYNDAWPGKILSHCQLCDWTDRLTDGQTANEAPDINLNRSAPGVPQRDLDPVLTWHLWKSVSSRCCSAQRLGFILRKTMRNNSHSLGTGGKKREDRTEYHVLTSSFMPYKLRYIESKCTLTFEY